MDVSHWVFTFLLFVAFQGGEQFPATDDTLEVSDVIPGGQSTDDIPMNIPESDEIAASYKSAGTFCQPADMPDISLDSDYSLPLTGCNSTASTPEELEYLQNTTQTPSNITFQAEETDETTSVTSSVVTYTAIAAFVISVIYFAYWVWSKYFAANIHFNQQFPQFFEPIQYLGTYRGTTFG